MDEQEIKQLKIRLDELEKLMKSLKGQGMSYYVNIEHAEIQGPVVDKLDYNFDKLDVKEVSGALNLGNNFGVRVGKVTKKEESGGKTSSAQSSQASGQSKSTTSKKKKTSEQPAQKGQGEEEKKKGFSDSTLSKSIGKMTLKPKSSTDSEATKTSEGPSTTPEGTVPQSSTSSSESGAGTTSAGGASSGGSHAAQIGGRSFHSSNEEETREDEGMANPSTSGYSQSPLHLGKRIPPGGQEQPIKRDDLETNQATKRQQETNKNIPKNGPGSPNNHGEILVKSNRNVEPIKVKFKTPLSENRNQPKEPSQTTPNPSDKRKEYSVTNLTENPLPGDKNNEMEYEVEGIQSRSKTLKQIKEESLLQNNKKMETASVSPPSTSHTYPKSPSSPPLNDTITKDKNENKTLTEEKKSDHVQPPKVSQTQVESKKDDGFYRTNRGFSFKKDS